MCGLDSHGMVKVAEGKYYIPNVQQHQIPERTLEKLRMD
jgi:hypothetical protein